MRHYSVDIFDRALNYKSSAQVTNVDNLVFDYISQEKTKLTVLGQLSLSRTDYVSLMLDENVIFQGIVSDYSYDKTYTTITMLPLQSMLDIDVWANVDQLNDQKETLENWLKNRFQEVFDGSDYYQNILGMEISVVSSTYGTIEEEDDHVYNLYDLIVDMIKVNGILVEMDFKPSTKKVRLVIHQTDVDEFNVIDTSETDVIEYTLKTANKKLPNKIIYFNSDWDDDQSLQKFATFYWHPDGFSGTVDQNSNAPRMLPVQLKIKKKKAVEEKRDKDGKIEREAKSFIEVCEEDAYDSMYRTSYDDEIELLVNSESRVIPIGDIGSRYVLIVDDLRYYTMLTSKEVITPKTMLLTFGMARTRLTQIVRENWRITNNESS